MTDCKLRNLVAEAVALDREIAEKTDRLKDMKKLLVAEAESWPEKHEPTDGGGWRCTFDGADGCIARVIAPHPSLKATIDAEKPAGAKVIQLVGKLKDQLFTPVLKYGLVDEFRSKVETLFDRAMARKIIKCCESTSPIQVHFETKDKDQSHA